MLPTFLSQNEPSSKYWGRRALETEYQLACAETDQLRAIYVSLVDHYRRMAALLATPEFATEIEEVCVIAPFLSEYDSCQD